MKKRALRYVLCLAVCLISFSLQAQADPLDDKVGYWKFEEGSGFVAYDETTYSNDGTLIYSDMWSSNGISGDRLIFDGTADYVTVS
ncbi:MAG: hypothetical protein ACYSTS_18415, partial [Planctomycetota bacterium]